MTNLTNKMKPLWFNPLTANMQFTQL